MVSQVAWTSRRPQPAVKTEYKNEKFGSHYEVKNGNTAWDVAKSGLQSRGIKVNNTEIMKELNRLAAINNCDSIDELAQKFGKIGNKIKVTGYSPETKAFAEVKEPETKKEPYKLGFVPNPFIPKK